MVITHNLAAMGMSRQLKSSVKKTEESSNKLGSGYRILTDKDDAAGLCISETMRRQVKSLNRADGNIADTDCRCSIGRDPDNFGSNGRTGNTGGE